MKTPPIHKFKRSGVPLYIRKNVEETEPIADSIPEPVMQAPVSQDHGHDRMSRVQAPPLARKPRVPRLGAFFRRHREGEQDQPVIFRSESPQTA